MKVAVVIGVLFVVISCSLSDDSESEKPIFTDVEAIEISQRGKSMSGSKGKFYYSIPGSADFVFVEVFDGEIAVDDDEKEIKTDNLVAGSRTGLEEQGFGSSSIRVNRLLAVKPDKEDFRRSTYYGETVAGKKSYYWAVIGLDENAVVTHASPAFEVEINWDE